MLADLDSLEKRVDALEKKAKGAARSKEAKETLDLVNRRSRCCATASRRASSSASPRRRSCFTSSAC
jgi:ribosome-binding ATPase YchF (GTP1/OBG family)